MLMSVNGIDCLYPITGTTITTVTTDSDGNVYTCDNGNNRIQIFNSDGEFITKWINDTSRKIRFNSPIDIAIDSQGYIYVVNLGSSNILKLDQNGSEVAVIGKFGDGSGELDQPYSVAIDSNNRVYVVDTNHNQIQVFEKVR